jgi:hypothetical protein
MPEFTSDTQDPQHAMSATASTADQRGVHTHKPSASSTINGMVQQDRQPSIPWQLPTTARGSLGSHAWLHTQCCCVELACEMQLGDWCEKEGCEGMPTAALLMWHACLDEGVTGWATHTASPVQRTLAHNYPQSPALHKEHQPDNCHTDSMWPKSVVCTICTRTAVTYSIPMYSLLDNLYPLQRLDFTAQVLPP